MQWRLRGLTALRWQYFDGDWAIYDDGSGQTIAADAVVAATLMAMEGGCTSLEQIEAQARHDLQAAADADLTAQVVAGLSFLEQLGLIEAATA